MFVLFLILAGCARHPRVAPIPATVVPISVVRVAIALSTSESRISSTSRLLFLDPVTGAILTSSSAGVEWLARPLGVDSIELRLAGAIPVVMRQSIIVRTDAQQGMVLHDGRRFRGSLRIWRDGDRLLVVNHLSLEEYLRGVVAMEIGNRRSDEGEAVSAQAVAARSFTYARLAVRRRDASRRYDMVADVSDQAYAGADAELESVSQRVESTAGMVLTYGGRVIEAVYSSSCGGATADAAEVWQGGGGEPYLRSVSDANPRGDGYYCGIAPSFEWSSTLTGTEVVAAVGAYVAALGATGTGVTSVQSITPGAKSPSGRVTAVRIRSDLGEHDVRGERMRQLLRVPGGSSLRSTMFELDVDHDEGAGVRGVTVRGRGYGHGVGMCQWGAIGRSRAGQNFRHILETYYPGARVQRL